MKFKIIHSLSSISISIPSFLAISVLVVLSNDFALTQTQAEEASTCHSSIGEIALNYIATKRPYNYNESTGNPSDFTPEGCSAVKLWYFGRHGTRYPGRDDILAMQTTLPGLHEEIMKSGNFSELCSETLQYFSTWEPRPDLNASMESYLHIQGEWELSTIASRFINRFPDLFHPQFTNESYLFKFTKSQRTEASSHSFASSIFGQDNLDTVYFPKPLSKDPVLKFYSMCPKWEQEVASNPEANKEHTLFLNSTVMNNTIFRVSKRLGLNRSLSVEEITTMFTTCAFESAWNNGTLSQWCALFDLEDFKVMQYREDLQYYYKDGYGFKINWEQACTPFVDALQFFEEYLQESDQNSTDYRKVQAYFSHSGSTLKMFARLGLFGGNNNGTGGGLNEIRHDNFEEVKDIYEWKTSKIDCFGTNMAFVMYSCGNDSAPEIRHNQIGFFTQEMPTQLPACDGKAFCPFEDFSSRLKEFTDNCFLNEICEI